MKALLVAWTTVVVCVAPSDITFTSDLYDSTDFIVSEALDLFAAQLDGVLRDQLAIIGAEQNVIFSPLSIFTVFALALLGANGTTQLELSRTLGVTSLYGDHPNDSLHYKLGQLLQLRSTGTRNEINIANGIFVQKRLRLQSRFVNLLLGAYNCEIVPVDFADNPPKARDTINNWVSQRTRHKIPQIINVPPSANTKVILASALYFRAAWRYPFSPDATQNRPFKVRSDKQVSVPMMVLAASLPYARSSQLKCQLLGLPYNQTDEMTMYILLPDGDGPASIMQLISDIRERPYALRTLFAAASPRTVIATVPRLQLDTYLPLRSALYNMGVQSMFTPNKADFSSMLKYSDVAGVYVQEVHHRVRLDIDETGSEAAAVTALSISRDGRAQLFRADHPFILIIRHESTHVPLFWASVMRPN